MRNNLYDDDVLDDLLFVLFIRFGQIPNCKFCSIIIPSFRRLLPLLLLVSFFFLFSSFVRPLPIYFAYMRQQMCEREQKYGWRSRKKRSYYSGFERQESVCKLIDANLTMMWSAYFSAVQFIHSKNAFVDSFAFEICCVYTTTTMWTTTSAHSFSLWL